jgi:hypothetical protein
MNKVKFPAIIILHIALTHVSEAQSIRAYSTFSLKLGAGQTLTKDEFQSQYTYKGFNPLIHASYERVKTRGQHNLDLSYSSGQIKSVVSPRASQKLISVNYDYFFNTKARKINRRLNTSVGVGLHAFLIGINYLPDIEQSLNNYSANLYLTLSMRMLYKFSNKSQIKVQVELPTVGVVYRPDFEINGKTLTKITTLNEKFLISTVLGYEFMVSSKVSLTADYYFKYFAVDEPRPLVNVQNSFSLGVKYKFLRLF